MKEGTDNADIQRSKTVEECANRCSGVSSMFRFGTEDYGNNKDCNKEGCKCKCELDALTEGTCNQKVPDSNTDGAKGDNLYKYIPKGINI